MARLLVVERDAVRRDALHLMLSQAGFDASAVDQHPEVEDVGGIDLLILGDDELLLLDRLNRGKGQLIVPVLVLIDPINSAGILSSLEAGVAGVFSRQRSGEEIIAKIRSLIERAASNGQSSPGEVRTAEQRYRQVDLVAALELACEDIGRLQEQYEIELTHRRKVEQALMESEAFYQSLVETLPLAMLRKDLGGRFTFANRLLCDAFKRPVEEIMGHSDHDFFPKGIGRQISCRRPSSR